MALIAGVQYSGSAVGTILPCGQSGALPMTLLCNGAAVSRTTYAALFAAISTNYGAGDGSTTFNVPNLQGVFPRGAGTQNRYQFTVTSANATAGATYTNNSQTFTVLNTISGSTTLVTNGTGAPTASGTLTKASGTGDATITFSANFTVTYSGTLGSHANDRMQGHRHNRNTNGTGENIVDTVAGGAGVPGGASRQIVYTTTGDASIADATNGTPRTGGETAPVHLGVNYCIAY